MELRRGIRLELENGETIVEKADIKRLSLFVDEKCRTECCSAFLEDWNEKLGFFYVSW